MSINDENIQRNDILEKIKLLEKIRNHYRGVVQQRNAFDKIVKDLREIYSRSKNLFSILDIDQLKYLVNEMKNSNMNLDFRKEELKQSTHWLPRGTVVLHKKEYYVGVIIDYLSRTSLLIFEDDYPEIEYKVFVTYNDIRSIFLLDFIVIGSSSLTNCFKCNSLICVFSDECGICKEKKCPVCGSCNCSKQHTTIKSPSFEEQDINKGRVKSNHHEITNGNSQGNYFPSGPNSHWPKNMQGPYGGRYRK